MENDLNQILENTSAQMRKGTLELSVLLIIARGQIYASDILQELKNADLIVVEGTLYPLLNRLKRASLLTYEWIESKSGPPRKYYTLTEDGKKLLEQLIIKYQDLTKSIQALIQKHE